MRHRHDFYETPAWQTRALLHHQPDIGGIVLDPCVGNGAIASALSRPGTTMCTNDWDQSHEAEWHLNASGSDLYALAGPVDWVVTNPPYTMPLCLDIVARAVREARVRCAKCGCGAALARFRLLPERMHCVGLPASMLS